MFCRKTMALKFVFLYLEDYVKAGVKVRLEKKTYRALTRLFDILNF